MRPTEQHTQTYHRLLRSIIWEGVNKEDRTGTGTKSLFGYQMRFPLDNGFPLITTKRVHLKSIIHELLWMVSGSTNIKYLNDNGVHIWDDWSLPNGELGPVYGKQLRARGSVDQLASVIADIKANPDSRRLVISLWNPEDLPEMRLPPCHGIAIQFYVRNGKLDCQMYQRSADVFLGVPFNIASYSLLTMMVAQVCDLEPGMFVHTFGDVHIYRNHMDQVKLQLSRAPRDSPVMHLNPDIKDIDAFRYEHFTLTGYNPHPRIKAEVAV